MTRWLLGLFGIAAAVLGWQLVVHSLGQSPLPTPLDVCQTLWIGRAQFAEAARYTGWRLLQGLGWGFVFASVLAFAASSWRPLREIANGPIELLRPIPPLALIPFFIVLFGLGDEAQIRLIALGTFMVFYIGWLEALRRTPDALVNSARSLGFEGLRLVLYVAVPFAWPAQKPIWRVAIATGLALSVAAEYLGAQGGLGILIRNAMTMLDLSTVGAASLLLGIIAVALDRAAVFVVDITSAWTRKSEMLDG